MVYWYNSTSFLDDLSWAAGWMYRATLDTAYLNDAVKFFEMHRGDVRPLPAPVPCGCNEAIGAGPGCKLGSRLRALAQSGTQC